MVMNYILASGVLITIIYIFNTILRFYYYVT